MAIALAIALSVTLLSFGEGVRGGYGQLLEDRGSDIYVGGAGSNLFLNSLNIFENGTQIAEEIENMSEVREAIPILSGYLPYNLVNETYWNLRNGTGISRVSLHGVIPGGAKDFVGEDRNLINGTGLFGPGQIVISRRIAEEIEVEAGDVVYINSFVPLASEVDDWMSNATPYIISAVELSLEGRRATMDLYELQNLSGLSKDEVSEIRVDLYDPEQAEIVAGKIEQGNSVTAFTVEDMIGETERFISSFKGLANVLSAVAIFVAGIFTTTIMVIATHERKKELGLLRALGFAKSTVLGHIMLQALFITLLGCIAGLALGFIGVAVVENILAGQFSMFLPGSFQFSKVTPPTIVLSLFMTFSIALVAGWLSYLQAMRIRVVEVLHGD